MFTHQKNAKQKGEKQERLAESWLRQQGLKLLSRNFHCRMGEIDLIMQDAEVCVFIEVRYRKNSQYGSASESVDYRKQKKLLNTATLYLQQNATYSTLPCRFDVIAINGNDEIEWIQNAFSA